MPYPEPVGSFSLFCVPIPSCVLYFTWLQLWLSSGTCCWATATGLSAHTESWKYLGFMFSGMAFSQWQLGVGVWKPASLPPVIISCEVEYSRTPYKIRLKTLFLGPCPWSHPSLTSSFSMTCSPHLLQVSSKSSSWINHFTQILISGSDAGELV